jgi:hypothetical protein
MESVLGKRVSYDSEPAQDSDDESDDESVVDSLMCLLDDVEYDPSSKSDRDDCKLKMSLINFGTCKNGICLYRDGSVLGDYIGISLPETMKDAEYVRIGVYLNHHRCVTSVSAPTFRIPTMSATQDEMVKQYGLTLGKYELVVRPSTLENSQVVYFKSRAWELSRDFSEAVGQQWPKFVITGTAYKNKKSYTHAVSNEFEVRSKEQSVKNKASMGLSVRCVKKRRTPETEARASKLRIVHSKIIEMRQRLQEEMQKESEYSIRRNFIVSITGSEAKCTKCQEIKHLLY